MKKINLIFYLLLISITVANANTIKVPDDQLKIQKAINSSSNGDTILVSPGTYFENINFNGKKVVLTSYYLFNKDTSYIRTTIINGSKPVHPDTASCVIIINGQDSTTVLQGFTLTGGNGTAWKDEHSSGTYREGGGVLVALSSPTIRNNLIIGNEAINKTGLASSGGGGIRCGDGSPKILNNVIINNNGRYGGGLVFNFCCAVVRNNIICNNIGGEDYGGGGIWINGGITGKQNVFENNTIINNHSVSDGGGLLMYDSGAKAVLKNNIIAGNTAVSSPQISLRGAIVPVTYCDIEGGWNGTGNINIYPDFTDSVFFLDNSSPCIDSGDENPAYNDQSDPGNTSKALFPSKGNLRNDIGAYGGPGSIIFPYFKYSGIGLASTNISFGNNNVVGTPVQKKIAIVNQGTDKRNIDSIIVKVHKDNFIIKYYPVNILKPAQSDSIKFEWTPADENQFVDTIMVYHNAQNIINPIKIIVKGKANNPAEIKKTTLKNSIQNFPNPFSNITNIIYSIPVSDASLIVYNISGEIIKKYAVLRESGTVQFDGTCMPDGIYFYKLIAQDKTELNGKMVILR